jgi:hypothetical protein
MDPAKAEWIDQGVTVVVVNPEIEAKTGRGMNQTSEATSQLESNE